MKRLKEIREGKGKKQQEVAEFIGVDRTTYSNYETGKRDPDTDTLLKLARYFDVSVDYLLGNTDDPAPPGQKDEITDDDIKYALWGTKEISDKQLERLKGIAKYLEDDDEDLK